MKSLYLKRISEKTEGQPDKPSQQQPLLQQQTIPPDLTPKTLRKNREFYDLLEFLRLELERIDQLKNVNRGGIGNDMFCEECPDDTYSKGSVPRGKNRLRPKGPRFFDDPNATDEDDTEDYDEEEELQQKALDFLELLRPITKKTSYTNTNNSNDNGNDNNDKIDNNDNNNNGSNIDKGNSSEKLSSDDISKTSCIDNNSDTNDIAIINTDEDSSAIKNSDSVKKVRKRKSYISRIQNILNQDNTNTEKQVVETKESDVNVDNNSNSTSDSNNNNNNNNNGNDNSNSNNLQESFSFKEQLERISRSSDDVMKLLEFFVNNRKKRSTIHFTATEQHLNYQQQLHQQRDSYDSPNTRRKKKRSTIQFEKPFLYSYKTPTQPTRLNNLDNTDDDEEDDSYDEENDSDEDDEINYDLLELLKNPLLDQQTQTATTTTTTTTSTTTPTPSLSSSSKWSTFLLSQQPTEQKKSPPSTTTQQLKYEKEKANTYRQSVTSFSIPEDLLSKKPRSSTVNLKTSSGSNPIYKTKDKDKDKDKDKEKDKEKEIVCKNPIYGTSTDQANKYKHHLSYTSGTVVVTPVVKTSKSTASSTSSPTLSMCNTHKTSGRLRLSKSDNHEMNANDIINESVEKPGSLKSQNKLQTPPLSLASSLRDSKSRQDRIETVRMNPLFDPNNDTYRKHKTHTRKKLESDKENNSFYKPDPNDINAASPQKTFTKYYDTLRSSLHNGKEEEVVILNPLFEMKNRRKLQREDLSKPNQKRKHKSHSSSDPFLNKSFFIPGTSSSSEKNIVTTTTTSTEVTEKSSNSHFLSGSVPNLRAPRPASSDSSLPIHKLTTTEPESPMTTSTTTKFSLPLSMLPPNGPDSSTTSLTRATIVPALPIADLPAENEPESPTSPKKESISLSTSHSSLRTRKKKGIIKQDDFNTTTNLQTVE